MCPPQHQLDVIKAKLDDNRQQLLVDMLSSSRDLHPDDIHAKFKGRGDRFLEAEVVWR